MSRRTQRNKPAPRAVADEPRPAPGPSQLAPPESPPESPPWKVSTKIIVIVSVLALMVLLLWRFRSLITPITLGAIIAYLLNPPIRLTSEWLKIGRGGAVAIVFIVTLVVVLVGGTLLTILGITQLTDLIRFLTDQSDDWARAGQSYVQQYVTLDGNMLQVTIWGLQQQFDVSFLTPIFDAVGATNFDLSALFDFSGIFSRIGSFIQTAFTTGGYFAVQFAVGTFGFIGDLILVLFISIYLAKDAPMLFQTVSDAAQVPGYRAYAEQLLSQFTRIWDAYLRGQVTLAIVIFLVVGVCLSILGVNNAWGLAVISGITEFLPMVGPIIGAGIAIVAALFQSENVWGLSPWMLAAVVAVIMLIIQQVENSVLVPRIVGGALDLHPLLILVGVLMGTSVAGVLGAILAAPVLATVKLLGHYAWRKIFDLPPFPEPESPDEPEPSLFARIGGWWQTLRRSRRLAGGRR